MKTRLLLQQVNLLERSEVVLCEVRSCVHKLADANFRRLYLRECNHSFVAEPVVAENPGRKEGLLRRLSSLQGVSHFSLLQC